MRGDRRHRPSITVSKESSGCQIRCEIKEKTGAGFHFIARSFRSAGFFSWSGRGVWPGGFLSIEKEEEPAHRRLPGSLLQVDFIHSLRRPLLPQLGALQRHHSQVQQPVMKWGGFKSGLGSRGIGALVETQRAVWSAYNLSAPSSFPRTRSKVPKGTWPAFRATSRIKQSENPNAGRRR
jgi:hypothetical protein